MAELVARSALSDIDGAPLVHEGAALRMRPTRALSLRLPRGIEAADASRELGIALPALNATIALGAGWVVGTEPKAWRILMAPGQDIDMAAKLATLPGALVSDLSSRFCTIELSGTNAVRAIASACPTDLETRVFAVGAAAATRFADVPVLLVKTGAAPCLLLIVERFHAEHAWRWLKQTTPATPTASPAGRAT